MVECGWGSNLMQICTCKFMIAAPANGLRQLCRPSVRKPHNGAALCSSVAKVSPGPAAWQSIPPRVRDPNVANVAEPMPEPEEIERSADSLGSQINFDDPPAARDALRKEIQEFEGARDLVQKMVSALQSAVTKVKDGRKALERQQKQDEIEERSHGKQAW